MKHAGSTALDELEPLLVQVRALAALKERRRGSFDSRFRVTLHFHEDPAGLFADLRAGGETVRLPVNDDVQRADLISRLTAGIATQRPSKIHAPSPL